MELKGFIGGSYEAQAWTLDNERTVNWYVERSGSPGASNRAALLPTPGVDVIATTGSSIGRGHFFMDGREFLVIRNSLLEADSSGILTHRGFITLHGGPVTISSNGDGGGDLFITSGGNGWHFDLGTNTLANIGALSGKADMGDQLDGYFLALDQDTSTFFVSDLLDGATWNTGTSFAQRSSAPDPWVSLKVLGNYVWLLGEQTSEVWYDSGGAFPFELHPSGRIPYGCAAPFSTAVGSAAIYWLGQSRDGDAYVMRSTGFTPEVISTPAVENAIGGYSTVADAYGECYSDLGHQFYVLTFPTAGHTWCYDAKTNLWHERGTWDPGINDWRAWRPRFHAFAFGEHRMLDAEADGLYRMGPQFGTDVLNKAIVRLRRAPGPQKENQRIKISSFEIDLDPGLGLTSGQGSDPQISMRYSDDGGKTWGPQIFRDAGALGEYSTRVRWERMGLARKRVFEVTVSDPIPWRLTNAYVTLGAPFQSAAGSQ